MTCAAATNCHSRESGNPDSVIARNEETKQSPPSPLEIYIYFGLLFSAFYTWSLLACSDHEPLATRWFFIYPTFLIWTELYLILRTDLATCCPRFSEFIYPWIKRSQRVATLAVIFHLTNGDLGTVIAIELAAIAFEFISRFGRTGVPACQSSGSGDIPVADNTDVPVCHSSGAGVSPVNLPPGSRGGIKGGDFQFTIHRVDHETARFLVITLAVLAISHPTLEIISSARWMLLAGLAVRSWMSIQRQSRGLQPGCPMDRRWAIILATWMLIVALLNLFLPCCHVSPRDSLPLMELP